jgi:hypothetical protein
MKACLSCPIITYCPPCQSQIHKHSGSCHLLAIGLFNPIFKLQKLHALKLEKLHALKLELHVSAVWLLWLSTGPLAHQIQTVGLSEQFVQPAYHQLTINPGSSTEISLEDFTKAAHSSAVLSVAIPVLDPLWICTWYDKACGSSPPKSAQSSTLVAWWGLVSIPPTHLSSHLKKVGPITSSELSEV